MLTQPTDYFYVLFIPGDTGDTAGHDLERVKRLQEPGMEVTEFFVSQVPSHTVHAQQGTVTRVQCRVQHECAWGKWGRR